MEVAAGDVDAVPPWEAAEDTAGLAGRPLTVDLALDEAEEVTPDVSGMVPVTGGVRVAIFPPKGGAEVGLSDLRCGERLEMPLRLRPIGALSRPRGVSICGLPGGAGDCAGGERDGDARAAGGGGGDYAALPAGGAAGVGCGAAAGVCGLG